jgi:hypothetical protein
MPVFDFGRLFSGLPDGAQALERIAQHGEEDVQRTLMAAAQQFLQKLRAQARLSKEWAPLADEITVWVDAQGRLAIGVPEDSPMSEAAQALEYGSAEKAPSGFLRNGVLRFRQQMHAELTQALSIR